MNVALWLLISLLIVGGFLAPLLFGIVGEGLFNPSKSRRLVERGIALALFGPLTIFALFLAAMTASWIGWRTLGQLFLISAALAILAVVGAAAWIGVQKARVTAKDDDGQS
jgi:MFS family permease